MHIRTNLPLLGAALAAVLAPHLSTEAAEAWAATFEYVSRLMLAGVALAEEAAATAAAARESGSRGQLALAGVRGAASLSKVLTRIIRA